MSRIERYYDERKRYLTSFNKNFGLLNSYLWIHFISCENRITWKTKYRVQSVVSLVLVAIIEIISGLVHSIRFLEIYNLEKKIGKACIALVVSYILETLLKFLMYTKRNKLNLISIKLLNVYNKASGGRMLNLKFKLVSFLFVNDLINIISLSLNWSFRSNNNNSTFNCVLEFITQWSLLSRIIPIIFCCYCYIIINVITEIKTLLRKNEVNILNFHYIYDDLISVISELNEFFQSLIFITFCTLLTWIFYDSYNLIFKSTSINISAASELPKIIIHFIRFIGICCCSSSVAKSSCELKDIIFNFPCYVTSFMLKNQNKFVGFTLLDSIIISKSLILASVGTLVTYGMLVSTFNENEL